MKNLHQSLIDYEITLLQAIAESRGVPLTTPNQAEAVKLLAEALGSPAAVAIALADLSEEEKKALQSLLDDEGRMEKPRFSRQFGPIRPMGPARLAREKPWRDPVNPAEALWYRGLIFKAFQLTDQGSVEMFYIPTDLLPLFKTEILNQQSPDPQPEAAGSKSRSDFILNPAPPPAVIISGANRLRENVFNLLVFLQTTPIRLQKNSRLRTGDQELLIDCLLPSLLPTFSRSAELEFLLHLLQRAGLVVVKHSRLRPDRDPTRAWLQSHPAQQKQQLQNSWRADPTWNDLWHVPGLVPQPTGWENSPLLARSKILDYLSQLEPSPETWFGLDDFVDTIKQTDPDFQRPAGDYESWYIQDREGRSLMGFDNWDKVEGALIRYLLTHLLPLLEVVEVGLPAPTGPPTSFRITSLGQAFLTRSPVRPPADWKPAFLRVEANFYAYVPVQASLYDRFQLARFATMDRREEERVVYRITQASVGRALRNGVAIDQIVAFLARATNNRTPLKVVETLHLWEARRGAAQIERATLLRLERPELVAELSQHPALGPLLGEVIGPQVILIPPENVKKVRQLLVELGFLEG